MLLITFVTLVVCTYIYNVHCAPLLPDYLKPCSRSDPNVKNCYVSHGNAALPYLLKGDKQLKLPNLLPLKFPRADANAGPDLKLSLIDIAIYGLDTISLKSMNVNFDAQRIFINTFIKTASIVGDYDIDGKIMILPVQGKGPFNITFENVDMKYQLVYKLEKKNGKDYMALQQDVTLDWTIDKAHFRFENLFNGNKQMGDNINNFLNENDQDVLMEVGSPVSGLMKAIAYKVGKSLLGNIPVDALFLP